MMETNFRRRASEHPIGIRSTNRSLSPKDSIKKQKQDRKTKERQDQEISNLNVLIGQLEDRDTQQQAFATLIGSLPELDPSMVKEVYALIEKNKLCPPMSGKLMSSASATSYDFAPPKPLGYSFANKRWKPAVISAHGSDNPKAKSDPSSLSFEATEEINDQSFDEHEGDEAAPSCEAMTDEDDPAPPMNQTKLVKSNAGTPAHLLPESSQDETFTELYMDQAAAPENGDGTENPSIEDEKSGAKQNNQAQHKDFSLNKVPLKSSVAGTTAQSMQAVAGSLQTVETLKQFVAKQRAQTRTRHAQHQDIPRISLPKRRRSRSVNQADSFQSNHDATIDDNNEQDDDDTTCTLELTRAEAAREAAQCGEYELAFRLCIVEDDLDLLRRTMTMIRTPCITTLSAMARNALCTAFLSLLDGDEGEDSPDSWLALRWLQEWAVDDRRQFEQLDPRIVHALSSKLNEMAMTSSKISLAAAHVVFLLRV
ncbi:hypothetical protein GN244_ATG11240 [Phytophthora infestans]|uniref:Uncharacterized protein n=1 Tax=Phytophthora infestans TaxID=4787 RepID=A0A833SQ44_PHYIN|nr:hypothetical protein GN244_ATG11240 [Phytophthora infestans]